MIVKYHSITFEIPVQDKEVRFSVPQDVCDLFGLQTGDNVKLKIKNKEFVKTLSSGLEIYGKDLEEIPEHVKKGIDFRPVETMEEVIEIIF